MYRRVKTLLYFLLFFLWTNNDFIYNLVKFVTLIYLCTKFKNRRNIYGRT